MRSAAVNERLSLKSAGVGLMCGPGAGGIGRSDATTPKASNKLEPPRLNSWLHDRLHQAISLCCLLLKLKPQLIHKGGQVFARRRNARENSRMAFLDPRCGIVSGSKAGSEAQQFLPFGPPITVVALQQIQRSLFLQDASHSPRKFCGLAQSYVHALHANGTRLMSSIPREPATANAKPLGESPFELDFW